MQLSREPLARPISLAPMPTLPSGLAEGTRILTPLGPVAVEHLHPGDQIVTRSGATAVILAAPRRKLHGAEVVVIEPDPFAARADGTPAGHKPLVLPARQKILLDDWRSRIVYAGREVLSAATALIDGVMVRREHREELALVSLEFAEPQLVQAEGAWVACPARAETARRPLVH